MVLSLLSTIWTASHLTEMVLSLVSTIWIASHLIGKVLSLHSTIWTTSHLIGKVLCPLSTIWTASHLIWTAPHLIGKVLCPLCAIWTASHLTGNVLCSLWLCMKWHGAWLYGVHRTCAETVAVSCGTSHASTVSTPLRWIFYFKKHAIKASHSCRTTYKCSECSREWRIAPYKWSLINQSITQHNWVYSAQSGLHRS